LSSLKEIRVLHSAALLSPPSGIINQMDLEADAVDLLGLNWRVKMYCPSTVALTARCMEYDQRVDTKTLAKPWSKILGWIKLRRNYHRWLLQQQESVDVFLLRYYVHDPFQWWFIRRCNKPVYFVHHTLETSELALSGGAYGFIRSNLEKLIGRSSIAKVSGIIGVTQEIVNYEIIRSKTLDKPSYVYPNGILYKELNIEDKRDEKTPELLFVANFAPWHGLDLLLKAVVKSNQNFVLHLVGDIPNELDVLIKDERVKVHGRLNHNQIIRLSEKCWIGLSSFALEKNRMKEACPLKVREYLMLGLPVYGNYKDIFPENSPCFATGDEKVENIIKFAHGVRKFDKKAISEEARKFIDKKQLVLSLYDWLQRADRIK